MTAAAHLQDRYLARGEGRRQHALQDATEEGATRVTRLGAERAVANVQLSAFVLDVDQSLQCRHADPCDRVSQVERIGLRMVARGYPVADALPGQAQRRFARGLGHDRASASSRGMICGYPVFSFESTLAMASWSASSGTSSTKGASTAGAAASDACASGRMNSRSGAGSGCDVATRSAAAPFGVSAGAVASLAGAISSKAAVELAGVA
jgi:hypothetical protein